MAQRMAKAPKFINDVCQDFNLILLSPLALKAARRSLFSHGDWFVRKSRNDSHSRYQRGVDSTAETTEATRQSSSDLEMVNGGAM